MQPHLEFKELTDEEKAIIEEMKKDKFLMDNLELVVKGVLSDQFPTKTKWVSKG